MKGSRFEAEKDSNRSRKVKESNLSTVTRRPGNGDPRRLHAANREARDSPYPHSMGR